ncbi:Transcription initiation factor IIF subunit alpha [Yarrowia sp. B02]|nr:Transcription initiation factor IIF subunit alpha [Yarrowia sp. B02]
MSKQTNPLMRSKKYDSPLRRDRPSLRPQMRKGPINIPARPGHKFIESSGVKKEENEPKYKEYSLVAASQDELKDLRYHIMRLHTIKNVDPASDFTPPIKLHRKDPRNLQFQATQEEQAAEGENSEESEQPKREQADLSKIAPDGGARHAKKNQFNRKAKQVVHRDEEAKKLRYEEYYPWVMEDYSGKNTWVGNYEAAQSDSYCVFVFHGNGFKMVPVEKFYKFTPRNQYATLTLEEAEKRMADSVKAGTPRWLMKHMSPEMQQSRMRDQRPRKFQTVDSGGPVDDDDGLSRRRERDDEDLDFDHVFDDDEEAPIMDGDEEDQKEVERKMKNEHRSAAVLKDTHDDDMGDLFGEDEEEKMDKEGRKLKKYLRSLEKNAHYDSDDDENPYASSEEDDDDEDEKKDPVKKEEDVAIKEEAMPLFVKKNITGLPRGYAVVQLPPHILAKFTRGVWNPNAKRPREAGDDESGVKRVKTEDLAPPFGPNETLLTDEHILNVLRTRPPMAVQDLLRVLMPIMKKDPENKARLTACLKKHAKVQNGVLVLRA